MKRWIKRWRARIRNRRALAKLGNVYFYLFPEQFIAAETMAERKYLSDALDIIITATENLWTEYKQI